MATEIKTRCTQGQLVVNELMITVGLGNVQSQSMPRSMLTSLDSKMVVPSIFGFGGGVNLVFHGQGTTTVLAGSVKMKDANAIKKLLGY
jgi:hypothetical protein